MTTENEILLDQFSELVENYLEKEWEEVFEKELTKKIVSTDKPAKT